MPESRHIVHIIDSLGVGGGQSMLFELQYAISKYVPQYTQSLVLLGRGQNKDFVASNNIEFETSTYGRLLQHIQQTYCGKQVCLVYHKLMNSRTQNLRPVAGRYPVVVINHTYTENCTFNRIRFADAVVAVCNKMQASLRRCGVKNCDDVIFNGVNGERYDSVPKGTRQTGDKLICGRINSFNSIKYSDDWTRWAATVQLPKPMILNYVGSGHRIDRAKVLVGKLSGARNQVLLHGLVSNFSKKVAMIKTWDVFLYGINRDEGLSISVLEALACGVPVVCSNHHGNNEIIRDGVNGYVYESLSHAQQILTMLCNEPQRLALLKASTLKDFRERLDARHMAVKYSMVIEKVCRDFPRRRHPKVEDSSRPVRKSGSSSIRRLRRLKDRGK